MALGASASLSGTLKLLPGEDSEDRPKEHRFLVTALNPVKAAPLRDASVMWAFIDDTTLHWIFSYTPELLT